jgi:hypothetical protein
MAQKVGTAKRRNLLCRFRGKSEEDETMFPLTLLATNKLLNLLTLNNALSQAVNSNAAVAGVVLAPLNSDQIIASFVGPDIGDLDLQLSYPRVCIFSNQVVNNQREKFRPFSGVVSVVANVWSSASLEQQTELALHFYVEGISGLLRTNIGDWGDGCRYSGIYDVRMQIPKTGGAGFVQSAAVTCNLDVSLN